ncbi:MAG: response regulator [Betaproteobacteria bacterium]|nr:MAG: response regulator [Betaproteobacteria bacterium]
MKLRSYLTLLTLATLVPVAIFAALVGANLVDQERKTFRRGAQEQVRALSTAIDASLKGSITTLEAFSLSPSLDAADLGYFRRTAAGLLAGRPDWVNINLSLPDGQQVVNLKLPERAPLPNIAAVDASLERVLRTAKPAVGDLVIGPVTKGWDFAVRVPVIRDGAVKYVLSAVVKPQALSQLVIRQDLPGDWIAMILDSRGRVVARNLNSEKSRGQLARPLLLKTPGEQSRAWVRARSLEGADYQYFYVVSETTGWAFAMGIPSATVSAVGQQAAWLFGLGLLGATGIAVALAIIISRRISWPIAVLASEVKAIGRGSEPRLPREPRIDEIRLLATALRTAAQAAREREDLVEREKQALQAADRAKNEFLAMLSHELRNPLAALTAAAHVLKRADPAREAAIKARIVVERQTRHMARLVEDLLDVSRITMGKATLEREILNLAQVASNVVQTWRAAGRLEGARVSVDARPVWINADRIRIEQIVANLLDNALKFTPAGQPITVSVRPEGDAAVLEVADEGQGMSPDMIGRVFELFTQGPLGPDHGKGGLGLGLALVKSLAELHGGSVFSASEGPGRGAVFTVRLPAVDGVQAMVAGASKLGRSAGSRRILVIEDNDDARQMLRALLALGGHEVREAPDGMSGIAAAMEARPDAVLIDIGLPDIDGYEVARRLRASAADGRIGLIAVTGYGQPEDEARALEAGFDAHLTKPVEARRLEEVIATVS